MEQGHHIEAEIFTREPEKDLVVCSHAANITVGQGNDLWRRCRAGGMKQQRMFFGLRETSARVEHAPSAGELFSESITSARAFRRDM